MSATSNRSLPPEEEGEKNCKNNKRIFLSSPFWGGSGPLRATVDSFFPTPRLLGGLTSVTVCGVDQLSKSYATDRLTTESITLFPGYFDLELVHNLGAAFGLFAGFSPFWRTLLLVGVAVFAILFLGVLLYRSHQPWEAFALGLILGGAIGNLLDRIRLGWVVDFIHLHWHDLSWPVFNLADSAITVGVALMVWTSWRPSPPHTLKNPDTGTDNR